MTKREFYKKLTERVKGDMAQVNEAQTKLAKLQSEIDSGMYSEQAISQKRAEMSELRMKITRIKDTIKPAIKNMGDEFVKELEAEDSLRGSELTDDAKLLTMGFPLNENDLKQILERNSSNRTMIRLVMRYADEHKIPLGVQYRPATADFGDPSVYAYAAEVCVRHSSQAIYDQIMGEGSDLAEALSD